MEDVLSQLLMSALLAFPSMWIGAAVWYAESWWMQTKGFAVSVFITWFLLLELGVWK